jgi:(p)ppGpp synthase/HD superfamily hydrolase
MKQNHDEALEKQYEGKIPDAIIFSFNAHAGQYRKDEPYQYVIHPLRVSEFLLKNFSYRNDMETLRTAAILHDVIEDTWADENRLNAEFGNRVTNLVLELTVPEQADKEKMHKDYLEQFKSASDEAKLIKLADLFDNIAVSMSLSPAKAWINYLHKSRRLLESMELKEKDAAFEKIKKELLLIIDEKIKSAEEK